MTAFSFTQSSRLDADPQSVWDRVITPEGINAEMRPFMRMTVPRGIESLDPSQITVGEPIGRSWILLFGVIPIDYDDLKLERLDPGRGFLERSTLGSMRVWEHERTIETDDGGCVLTDRIAAEPRALVSGRLLAPIFRWFFRHRHRQLQRHFGGEPAWENGVGEGPPHQ